MKIDAKEMNCLFSSMTKGKLKKIAIDIIYNNECIHEIGGVRIFKLIDLHVSVNTESLLIRFFNLESEAIDYYLDQYKGTKEFKQQELFNQ